jgi:hypothetical protein
MQHCFTAPPPIRGAELNPHRQVVRLKMHKEFKA